MCYEGLGTMPDAADTGINEADRVPALGAVFSRGGGADGTHIHKGPGGSPLGSKESPWIYLFCRRSSPSPHHPHLLSVVSIAHGPQPSKNIKLKNPRNKQFIHFKPRAILSSVMKSYAVGFVPPGT